MSKAFESIKQGLDEALEFSVGKKKKQWFISLCLRM